MFFEFDGKIDPKHSLPIMRKRADGWGRNGRRKTKDEKDIHVTVTFAE